MGDSALAGTTEEAMMTSTEPVSPEHIEGPVQSTAQADALAALMADGLHDLYAESELQLRQERTERMIRRAQEQA